MLSLLLLLACGNGPKNAISLDWNRGDSFHVGASYRLGAMHTEESMVDLDGGELPAFGEAWSDEVTWTYQVVETGLVPDANDELRPYAETHDGVAALTVVRAWVDASLNDDPELLEADPVVYLVFREDRDRLAAIITFTDGPDGRVEQAWSTRQLGRSWSPLSQSTLTMAPVYLAPWGATYEDRTLVLENGSELTTETVDGDVVDAFYEDEVGGGLVVSRYEKKAPWPVETVSDNVVSRLLDDGAVAAKSRRARGKATEPPPDFDYRAALSAAVDIDAALTLDEATMGGGFDAEAYQGYQPWAGSWWNLKEGALIFGYDNRDTLSDRLKDQVDPIKRDMDALSSEIREMTDGSAKDAKVSEYQTKQTELVEALVTFYDTLLQDLNGGRLTVSGGRVSHVDGWSYDLDELSPMDKKALRNWAEGQTSPNPFYLPAWEILNMYNPGGGSWWGHCNGWAAAALLTNEPTGNKSVTVKGESMTLTSADQKGLLSESHYSTYSNFFGQRYDGADDDLSDLTPAAFHRLVSFYLKEQGVGFVMDTTASEEVWNFPAWRITVATQETTQPSADAGKININTADLATLDTLPGIGSTLAGRIITHRETYGPFQSIEAIVDVDGIGDGTYEDLKDLITVSVASGERTFEVTAEVTFATDGVHETHVDSGSPESIEETWNYTLVTDANGLVLRGTWEDNAKHPDFAWVPYQNPTSSSSGSSENPYLSYAELLEVLGDGVVRE